MATSTITSVNFEVFGKVQGVFFRKHTQSEAKKLGLTGWVQNTPTGTVVGVLEGPADKIKIMKLWLEKTGSPESHIDKCVFTNEIAIAKPKYSDFEIVKKKWLAETGSPKSVIKNCEFREEKKLQKKLFSDFSVKH